MKGDFSRATFDRAAHRRNTLLQQGRALLDATWNEQQELTQYRAETATADLLGPTGGPAERAGFWLDLDPTLPAGDFRIGSGHYYVDGILCENEAEPTSFLAQPDWPGAAAPGAGVHLVYLDVWLRHQTALDAPGLREAALGGADADTRVRVVWQVKTVPLRAAPANLDAQRADLQTRLQQVWGQVTAPGLAELGALAARTTPMAPDDKPCLLPPAAGFQGLENRLYRVEVHRPGAAGTATFKWSRDNGALVVAVRPLGAQQLAVVDGLQGGSIPFAGGDWAELTDDARELRGLPGDLVQVGGVDPAGQTVALAAAPAAALDPARRYQLRKWDGAGAAVVPVPPATGAAWVPLEDGIEVRFAAGEYRTGDYWLIPARTAVADIEWPRDATHAPLLVSPAGVTHHYARLALLAVGGAARDIEDLRALAVPLGGSATLTRVLANLGSGREFALRDGLEVRTDWLAQGLYLAFDRPLDPPSVSPAACAVTVELPFPGNAQDRATYGNAVVGYQPVVLAGTAQADPGGGLLWQPESAARGLLQQGIPNIARRKLLPFAQEWEVVEASAAAPGKWGYDADGTLLQTSRDPRTGFGTVALNKYALPADTVRVAVVTTLRPLNNESSDVGVIFHWKDAANYTGAMLTCSRSVSTGGGDRGVTTGASFFQVVGGNWTILGNSPSSIDGSFRVARAGMTVYQTGNQLSLTVTFAAADGSLAKPPIILAAALASPQALGGTRVGAFARNATAQFFSLGAGPAGLAPDTVLLPGGGSERALARLTVRRGLLRSAAAAASAPRFGAAGRPQPDLETWFWLVNPPRYDGGSAGIGVSNLDPVVPVTQPVGPLG